MALVVESTSSNAVNNLGQLGQDTFLDVTAPTGITAGDLLIAIGSQYGQSSPSLPTDFTSSDTVFFEDGGTGDIAERESSIRYGYKVAVSADESATNYRFTSFNDGGAGCVLRISGWNEGDPIFDKAGTNSDSLPLTRVNNQLVIMGFSASCTDGSPGFSYDGYTITSSDSNPTWTEVMDSEYATNGDSDTAGLVLAVAYANSSDTSNITAYSATLTDGTTSSIGVASFCFVIGEPQDVTPDLDHITASPTLQGLTAANNVAGDVNHLDGSPTLNGAESKTDNQIWTNETKGTTTWTNEQK